MRLSLFLALLLAGCGSSGTQDRDEANQGVTVELAPAESAPLIEAVPPAPAATPSESLVKPAPPPSPPPPPKAPPEQKADKEKTADKAGDTAKEERSEAKVADPRFRPGRTRLSDRLVAQTIDRIGYPCGEVVSTEEVATGGSARIYRITCSSGASYQATDRGGGMRFRKWTGVPAAE